MDLPESEVRLREEYGAWLDSPSSCIVATGGLGGVGNGPSGHTLFRKLRESGLGAAYFSFAGTDVRRASAASLLGSVAFQLLDEDPARFPRIEQLYEHMQVSKAWTQSGLWGLFYSLLDTKKGLRPLHLVIDGLHRCDSSWQQLLDDFLTIFNNDRLPTKLKVALFYQERQDIHAALNKFENFRVHCPVPIDKSHKPFMDATALASRLVKHTSPYFETLKSRISEALERCNDVTELSLTLQFLSTGGGTPRTLRSVDEQIRTLPICVPDVASSRFRASRGWARLALGWVLYAKRPLRLNELATAVALTDHKADFVASIDPQYLPLDVAAEVKSAFGPLLRVEGGGLIFGRDDIRDCFLDSIAEEQRLEITEKDNSDSKTTDSRYSQKAVIPDDAQITRILLKYLSSEEFAGPVDRALKQEEYMQPSGPLFDLATYAVQFWPVHYRAAEKLCPHNGEVLKLVQDSRLVQIWPRLNARLNGACSPPDLCVADPLLLAAQLGLTDIVKSLEKGISAANRDAAISLASWGGHADIVNILLRNADSGGTRHLSEALRHASACGHDRIIKQLLEHMQPTHSLPSFQLDELVCQAARLGHSSQVSWFLQYGASVDAAPDGITPLQHAAENGHASVVHLLLTQANADVNSDAGKHSDTPLKLAATKGYEVVVEHLLASHADVTSRTDHCTPLFLAAEHGHEAIVRVLLDHLPPAEAVGETAGMETSSPVSRDHDGTEQPIIGDRGLFLKDPLLAASKAGHTEIMKLLLEPERGADVTLCDDAGHTALYYAILSGKESLGDMILSRVESVYGFKDIGDVFLHAAESGLANLVERCLVAPVPVDGIAPRDYCGDLRRTALHYAARSGHKEIVSSLLDAGAAVDPVDEDELTPLALAAMAGHADTVQVLLQHGADALKKMSDDQTIVIKVASIESFESSAQHGDVISILLENGVDANAIDALERTALHWAARQCNVDVVKSLLKHAKTDATLKGEYGWNALHFMASNRSRTAKRVAELLINAGTDPLVRDVDDWIPLHVASQWGNVELLELLSKQHPDSLEMKARDERTALHFGYDEPGSLKWLLEHGADANAIDEKDNSTLMMAAGFLGGIEESVRVLLDNRANPRLQNKQQRTALHRAARSGNITIGRELLEKDTAILHYKDEGNLSALHLAILEDKPSFVEMLLEDFYLQASLDDLDTVERDRSETPLISAVRKGHEKVVKKLLELGANTELRDKSGDTALLAAVEEDSVEILLLLLNPDMDNHADVNASTHVHPTALYAAARGGKIHLVEELVRLGARVDAEGGPYNTAISAAAVRGNHEIVEYLLKQEADPGLHGGEFSNALSAALYSETFELAAKLIKAGVDINAKDSQGRTSLHIAALRGSWQTIDDLQAAGGDPTVKDKQGRTLLHHAVMGRSSGLVSSLLENEKLRSKLDVKDVDGWTPLHWACRDNDNIAIVRTLVEYGADIMQATTDGWTPENIAIFHDADDIVAYIGEEMERREEIAPGEAGDAKSGPQPGKPARPKRWKVGVSYWGAYCNGCLLFVSN